jgi:CSLREA domain-containing protein
MRRLGLAVVLLVTASRGFALTVTSTGDGADTVPGDGQCVAVGGGCTLRAAVEEASSSDASTPIVLPAGTYQVAAELVVARGGVAIQGAGTATTIIDAGETARAFDVHGGTVLGLDDLTVRKGDALQEGGAIRAYDATVTLDAVSIAASGADANGGGLFAAGSTVTITSSTFTADAGLAGGAIAMMGGALAVSGSTFTGCVATDVGGAIAVFGANAVAITGCTFTDNKSQDSGGAVFLGGSAGGATYTIADTTFTGNDAWGGSGGAIFADGLVTPGSSGALTVTGSTFTLNQADRRGGAIATLVAFTSTGNAFQSNDAPEDPDVAVPTILPVDPAPACTGASACDDGDLCTDDACTAGACTHAAKTSFAAVMCQLDTFDAILAAASSDALDAKWKSKLAKASGRARAKVGAASTATKDKKRKKALKASGALLKKTTALARKGVKKKKVAAEVGASLQGAIDGARAAMTGL